MSDAAHDDDGTVGRVWERGHDGHDAAQRLRLARLPLAERLQWLEEAHRLVRHLAAQRERRPGGAPRED